jgi:hypothetical protein
MAGQIIFYVKQRTTLPTISLNEIIGRIDQDLVALL